MSTQSPPAISGVSSGQAFVMAVYPSIACTSLGKWLGRLYDSMPVRIGGIKLSHLLFPLPTSPLAIAVFAHLKLFGEVYVLTNRTIQLRTALGNRLKREVALSAVDQIVVRQEPGQEFYPAADIYLLDKAGATLMSLSGVPRADVFRHTLLDSKRAHDQVVASLSTIKARHP
jgi:hypothetical protein